MKKSKTIELLMFLIVICITATTVKSYAANSVNKEVRSAYLKQVKKDKKEYKSNNEKISYAFKDLNGDGIDELITYPGYGFCTEIIYTYNKGKVKEIANVGQGDFSKFYKKNKVLYCERGHMDVYNDEYYKFKGKKLIRKAYRLEIVEWDNGANPVTTYEYYINDNNVSKDRYEKYVKKLTKGDKAQSLSKIKWKTY